MSSNANSPQNPNHYLVNTQYFSIVKFLKQLPRTNSVVFDIGAKTGDWSKTVFSQWEPVQIYTFESSPQNYHLLQRNLADFIKIGSCIPIQTIAPEEYCKLHGIRHIGFIRIDEEINALALLMSIQSLVQEGRIDYFQFQYHYSWEINNVTLKQVIEFLKKQCYCILKFVNDELEYDPHLCLEDDSLKTYPLLAVCERLRPLVLGSSPEMLNLPNLFEQYSITPKNVIHIGAHEGQEISLYQTMGVQGVLFVEANPIVYERLEANLMGINNMVAVQCAISDRDGTINLHITSHDQSSSILPLKHHSQLYPEIQEIDQLEVTSITLDHLIEDLQLEPSEFNILNLDIQGAELLALQGAVNLLPYIDAINTEINYEELYEGCALVDQVDTFLETFGFKRVATTTPYHPTWGDALYVRKS